MAHKPGIVDWKLEGETFTSTYADTAWESHYSTLNAGYGHRPVDTWFDDLGRPVVKYKINIPAN